MIKAKLKSILIEKPRCDTLDSIPFSVKKGNVSPWVETRPFDRSKGVTVTPVDGKQCPGYTDRGRCNNAE